MQNVPAKRPQKQIQTEPAWVASNPPNQRDLIKRVETVGLKGLDEGWRHEWAAIAQAIFSILRYLE